VQRSFDAGDSVANLRRKRGEIDTGHWGGKYGGGGNH